MLEYYNSQTGYYLRLFVALTIVFVFATTIIPAAGQFRADCHMSAKRHSYPQIVFKSNGQTINDYLDAYYFLRDRTPKSARIMAWWDYGTIYLLFYALTSRLPNYWNWQSNDNR
jgi:hypothetical protein